MRSCLANLRKTFAPVRIAFIAAMTLLLSGWTCSAMFNFKSCQDAVAQAQITSLTPDTIPSDAESVLLTVDGSGFTLQSQILWNGTALATTFTDSRHLQTTITQPMLDSVRGSVGSSVQISIRSRGSVSGSGCPKGRDSATQALVIK